MIVLCSLSDLGKYRRGINDINFMVVRHMEEGISGIHWLPKLAPSESLFSFTKKNRDTDNFWDLYHKMFKEELTSYEKQVGLNLVVDYAKRGYEVNLVCYCKDPTKCHRYDLYEMLKSRGIECELH